MINEDEKMVFGNFGREMNILSVVNEQGKQIMTMYWPKAGKNLSTTEQIQFKSPVT